MATRIKKKRKLVYSVGSAKPVKQFPQQYISSSLKWLGEVSVEFENGVVDEFEISPSHKLPLAEFLTIVGEEIKAMSEDGVVDWGVKIFRV